MKSQQIDCKCSKTRWTAVPLVLAAVTLVSACEEQYQNSAAQLSQTVDVYSVPKGAVCDIYALPKEQWKNIDAARKHRNDVALIIGKKKAWEEGIPLQSVPAGSKVVLSDVQLPKALKVKRTDDFLIADCTSADGRTATRGYTYRDNPDSQIASIADPTFVGVDLLSNETGFAYLYPASIVINLE
ncbi:hypothetical protein [Ruegeria halocynthiae]|uniref:hypothetical protein n=1 Tax=Ruegeria halocynthiae TaxID=985054 RepID=UPI00055DA1DB|nr:hypothetical protein [Ruegeria halocynthiae]